MELGHCSETRTKGSGKPQPHHCSGTHPVAVCHTQHLGHWDRRPGSTAIATKEQMPLLVCFLEDSLHMAAILGRLSCTPLRSSSRAQRCGCCDWVGPSAYPEGRPWSLTALPGVKVPGRDHSLHSTAHHWKDHSTGDWGTQDGTMEVEGKEILLQGHCRRPEGR